MADVRPYLLRTRFQVESFRERHAGLISEKGAAMRNWFQGLPLYEWVPFRCRSGEESATVGLLCHLYIQGDINLTVSSDGRCIQRGTLSDGEHETWCKARFNQ